MDLNDARSNSRRRILTLGYLVAMSFDVISTLDRVRPVKIRSAGSWLAKDSASAAPRPFGPIPVIRTA